MPKITLTRRVLSTRLSRRLLYRLVLLALLLRLDEMPPLGLSPPLAGIAVLGPIERGDFLEIADIQAGDTLLTWKRFDRRESNRVVRQGRFDSPFDLIELLAEEGPRGPVRLDGLRSGKAKSWKFKAGALSLDRWRANTLPAARGFDRSRIRTLMTLIENSRLEAGNSGLVALAARLEPSDPTVAAWILAEEGVRASFLMNLSRAHDLTERAIRILDSHANPRAASHVIRRWLSLGGGARPGRSKQLLNRVQRFDKASGREFSVARNLEVEVSLFQKPKPFAGPTLESKRLWDAALRIRERAAPESYEVAVSLDNQISYAAKYLERLEHKALLLRKLALLQQLTPAPSEVANVFQSLGLLSNRFADFKQGEIYFRKSLPYCVNRQSLIRTLNNMGGNSRDRAISDYCRSLLLPNGTTSPDESTQSDLRQYQSQIRELMRRPRWARPPIPINPGVGGEPLLTPAQRRIAKKLGRNWRWNSSDIGSELERRGKLDEAEYATRFEIQVSRSPRDQANLYLQLGRLLLAKGKRRQALDQLYTGLDLIDDLDRSAGNTPDAQAQAKGQSRRQYLDTVEALLGHGMRDEAFEILERERGWSTWEALKQPSSSEIDARYDRLKNLLGANQDSNGAAGRLHFARSFNSSDWQRQPNGKSSREAMSSIDHRTVFLSYALGLSKSYLFIARPNQQLAVLEIPSGELDLKLKVPQFREKLRRNEPTWRSDAIHLYDLLLRPAQIYLDSADRIAISADGPLQQLPFAALIHDGRLLAEEKPVHRLSSVAAFSRLKARRPGEYNTSAWRVLAFGDPSYPPSQKDHTASLDHDVKRAVERGLSLAPLPGSRKELRILAGLFPRTRVFLGPTASEATARQVASEADLLHFATHGLLDPGSPFDSALALAEPNPIMPGRDNGLLQAWEVSGRLRIKAELVTLSACNTAPGEPLGDSGLLGLSWAFQEAGARSVLSSTWSVSDRATAELMGRFYRNLRAGLSKDESLRRAQATLIRMGDPKLAAPSNWAGFELFGDWR